LKISSCQGVPFQSISHRVIPGQVFIHPTGHRTDGVHVNDWWRGHFDVTNRALSSNVTSERCSRHPWLSSGWRSSRPCVVSQCLRRDPMVRRPRTRRRAWASTSRWGFTTDLQRPSSNTT
jgi:hypothetical protein